MDREEAEKRIGEVAYKEAFQPIQYGNSSRVHAAIWVMTYRDTTLKPYNETIFTISVTGKGDTETGFSSSGNCKREIKKGEGVPPCALDAYSMVKMYHDKTAHPVSAVPGCCLVYTHCRAKSCSNV